MTSHKELGDWVLEDAHSAGLGEQQSLASEDDDIRVGRSTPNPVVSPNLNAPRSPKEEAGIEQDLESAGTGMGVALARLMQCLIEDWQLIEEEPIPAGGSKRVFALMKQKTSKQKAHAAAMFSNPTRDRYDYEQKYP
ncbi:hypothetical protein BDV98DRAFT_99040 [Pterulicium gracile]|uniref:Uncharacterized protein n=1 Tax=Pterulicium gracile TaxID=1884261 RepID=A0A5C3QHZ7_9AGAR|nr:hypothetical protein BDV98DRAFT_99040 [Pterula gracilis]